MSASLVARGAVALVRRPRLWRSALGVAGGLVPRNWWRRPPFLPLPDRGWLAFRSETAYGDATRVPSGEDIVAFVAFVREQRLLRSAGD